MRMDSGSRLKSLAGLASQTLSRYLSHARHCVAQDVGAALEPLSLLLRHLRLEDLAHAVPAEDAGQRKGDSVFRIVRANGNDRLLVAQDRLRDARRDHTNPKLARAGSFANRDICIADILLYAPAKFVAGLATLPEQLRYGRTRDTCRRPQEHLGRAVLSDHLRLHILRVHLQPAGYM